MGIKKTHANELFQVAGKVLDYIDQELNSSPKILKDQLYEAVPEMKEFGRKVFKLLATYGCIVDRPRTIIRRKGELQNPFPSNKTEDEKVTLPITKLERLLITPEYLVIHTVGENPCMFTGEELETAKGLENEGILYYENGRFNLTKEGIKKSQDFDVKSQLKILGQCLMLWFENASPIDNHKVAFGRTHTCEVLNKANVDAQLEKLMNLGLVEHPNLRFSDEGYEIARSFKTKFGIKDFNAKCAPGQIRTDRLERPILGEFIVMQALANNSIFDGENYRVACNREDVGKTINEPRAYINYYVRELIKKSCVEQVGRNRLHLTQLGLDYLKEGLRNIKEGSPNPTVFSRYFNVTLRMLAEAQRINPQNPELALIVISSSEPDYSHLNQLSDDGIFKKNQMGYCFTPQGYKAVTATKLALAIQY